ncbi:MAG: hypothetical protein DRQ02_05710 [Candidatus Latescibacterota bacterium]|nr:MAG: hypothetical protein DRQ02_05710 [Candidatus Latescibacterota bacterium]
MEDRDFRNTSGETINGEIDIDRPFSGSAQPPDKTHDRGMNRGGRIWKSPVHEILIPMENGI